MALRAVQVQIVSPAAPVSGYAVYLVVEESAKKVGLLHPWTLSAFSIPLEEFQRGEGATYWPESLRTAPKHEKFNIETVTDKMSQLLEDYALRKVQHPAQMVRRVIAEIKGIPLEEVPQFREARAPRAAQAVSQARRPGVIDAIKDALAEGFTIDEMVKLLKDRFPERDADGMKNTVKCQLARLPKNVNREIVKAQEDGRGLVFKWGT